MSAAFRAMGCRIVVGGADERALRWIIDLFRSRERVFSRFLPASELSRVNACTAPTVVVSEVFAAAVEDAVAASTMTGGLVDATIGEALRAAGYDRDFDLLRVADDVRAVVPTAAGAAGRMSEVVVAGRLVWRPPGLTLDLNGVVKSRAADDAAALLPEAGFVSAGGDIAVTAPTAVALPAGGSVAVRSGGIATSGTLTRSWRRAEQTLHHLVDPRTGTSSRSRWTAVTVAAGSCLAADVAAKAAFLLDDEGPAWLDQRALPGRFLRQDGHVGVNEAWRASVGASGRAAA